jgi:hypothetical protein
VLDGRKITPVHPKTCARLWSPNQWHHPSWGKWCKNYSGRLQVAVSCCRSGARNGGLKDTLVNILETREFVVNIMSAWFVESANHTCGNYDTRINEFQVAGLTQLASEVVKAPRVAESAVHMECLLRHHWHVQNEQVRFFLGAACTLRQVVYNTSEVPNLMRVFDRGS